jgi:hypothetical protein
MRVSPSARNAICVPWLLALHAASATPRAVSLRAAYLRPSCLYPAALQYQLASGFIQRCSHGRLLIKGASDGADMLFGGSRRGCGGVEGAGCRQLQMSEW